MKFLYVVQVGFGELAQAEAFALYARKQGDENIFITDKEEFKKAMDLHQFTTHVTKTCEDARALIQQLNPDVLFLCSSKTTHMYPFSLLKLPPMPKPFCVSLDSNWLWWNDERSPFKAPEWLDLIFVVIPEAIFQKGLFVNGGHYQMKEIFREKIYCPGFIPSGFTISHAQREKIKAQLGIEKKENLIFTYLGLKEQDLLEPYIRCLEEIVSSLNAKVFIKLNKERCVPQYDWLITKAWLSADEFSQYLASSDLVIQHHGLGTLPKAIRNQIPALCITEKITEDYPPYKHSAYFEIKAFADLNLCKWIDMDFSPESLNKNIQELLYKKIEIDRMRNAQETFFESGEAKAYDKLIQEWKKLPRR